jgi:predicted TIM-barrel fold metal-dependent hydrolase
MNGMASESNYIVVSTDTHAGADLLDYKPYLEKEWHDEFDAWAASFVDPWQKFHMAPAGEGAARPDEHPDWDSDLRLNTLEGEGVAAEVIYPNTIPPFFPLGGLSLPAPRTRLEYEQRWAGLRSHNRWQVDFCSQAPGRRKGLAQVFLNNVDDAVAEARWAKERDFGGILIPSVAPNDPTVRPIYKDDFEPLWSVCEDLDLAVCQHAGSGSPEIDIDDPADRAIVLYEVYFFSHRSLWHLILGGVLERHPRLRFAFTEEGAYWIPRTLASLDALFSQYRVPGSGAYGFGGEMAKKLPLSPSEYFKRQCAVATFLTRHEVEMRNTIGVASLMWATDYPHGESTVPNSRAAMRKAFAGVSEDDTRQMLGLNAVAFFGFDEHLIADIAQRIGPSPSDVNEPLTEPPAEPRGCPVFWPDDSREVFA